MTAMSDVQVFDYMDDDGHKVQITLAVHGDPDKYRPVDVTLYVDEEKRAWSSDHAGLPPKIPLGEHLIYGVLACIHKHVSRWCMWALMDWTTDLDKAGVGEDGYVPMPVEMRHWKELPDEVTWWWVEHPLFFNWLRERVRPAAAEAVEKYKDLLPGPTKDWD